MRACFTGTCFEWGYFDGFWKQPDMQYLKPRSWLLTCSLSQKRGKGRRFAIYCVQKSREFQGRRIDHRV